MIVGAPLGMVSLIANFKPILLLNCIRYQCRCRSKLKYLFQMRGNAADLCPSRLQARARGVRIAAL